MLNKSVLMGRLTKEPEMRHTPNGVPVASFTLACERDIPTGNGTRLTDFIDITAWRGAAEFVCKWFKKGSLVAVEGRIQTRNYETKDGQKRKAFEIVADSVYFAEGKKDTDRPQNTEDLPPALEFEEVIGNEEKLPWE